jgi:hypothetical protein
MDRVPSTFGLGVRVPVSSAAEAEAATRSKGRSRDSREECFMGMASEMTALRACGF